MLIKAIKCPTDLIVKSVDDLPIVWIACAQAKGRSYFKGISELRLKESDRIESMSKSVPPGSKARKSKLIFF